MPGYQSCYYTVVQLSGHFGRELPVRAAKHGPGHAEIVDFQVCLYFVFRLFVTASRELPVIATKSLTFFQLETSVTFPTV